MNTAELSLSDAPPFRTIYPFFIAAALFGSLSFAALAFTTDINRYDPYIVGSIHLFTIGFLLNATLGSLTQMLPVVGGVKIESPKIIKFSFFAFSASAVLFFAGFVFYRPLLGIAGLLILCAAVMFFGMLLINIFSKKEVISQTLKGMRAAIIVGVFAILLGLHLLASHAIGLLSESHAKFTQIHILLAVFGFFGTLIISVAHQVLPMFYVSPEFPKFCRAWPIIISIASTALFIPVASNIAIFVIWNSFVAFAIVALKKIKERKRLMSDASLRLWQTGLVSLIIGLALWAYSLFFELKKAEFLFVLFFGLGFLGSIVKAMINKIVPFLAWFHLTSMGKWDAPSVREMISDKDASIELWLHWSSLALFGAFVILEPLFQFACIFAAASFAVLLKNIIGVLIIFKRESKSVPTA